MSKSLLIGLRLKTLIKEMQSEVTEMNKVVLRPGIPDDDNRDYLPEKCKESSFVVNENGNNSQPYPEGLIEVTESISGQEQNVWYEYVPKNYNSSLPVPLVISLHGGLMTGWGQAIYTSWTLMAERDGFIVIFPNACRGRVWQVQWGKWDYSPDKSIPGDIDDLPEGIIQSPKNLDENEDVMLLLNLIDLMKKKYNIDNRRIFMQGMSMGNLMTDLFARNFGDVLAGAAGSGCSSFLSTLYDQSGNIINKAGPVPMWHSRPELNGIPPGDDGLSADEYNREYWLNVNECELVPEIEINGETNLAFFKGSKADYVYCDIKNRDHGQSFDDASLIWDHFFSGLRRLDNGSFENVHSDMISKFDTRSVAFADGMNRVWFDNGIISMSTPAVIWNKLKYHGLNGGKKVRGSYMCVPLSTLGLVFNCVCTYSPDRLSAEIRLADGRLLQVARGNIGCVIDDRVRQMYCETLQRDDELLISVEWFSRMILNYHTSSCDGIVYISDHHNEISKGMAYLIRDLLSVETYIN